MIARFNPTGTHVHKGFLKVRIDIYPDVGDKTYEIHHIQVPVIPPEGYLGKVDAEGNPVDQNDYNNWIDSLPKVWQLNPALCHFVKISETTSLVVLKGYVENLLDKDTLATLDNYLILPNSAHLVSPLMRGKQPLSIPKVESKDLTDLIGSVNERFNTLTTQLSSDGKALDIEPQSIVVGAGIITGGTTLDLSGVTYVSKSNPANATGILDTWKFYFYQAAENVKVATFSASGDNLTTRDSELIGYVFSSGPRTFTGLDIDVETGDYGGWYNEGANAWTYHDWSGGGYWHITGDYIPCSSQAFNVGSSSYKISVYATGEEAAPPTGQPYISRVQGVQGMRSWGGI